MTLLWVALAVGPAPIVLPYLAWLAGLFYQSLVKAFVRGRVAHGLTLAKYRAWRRLNP